MSFALGVARELGIPTMSFWTASAASLMTHMRLRELQERGYVLKGKHSRAPPKSCTHLHLLTFSQDTNVDLTRPACR
jgi:hypothetical protein